MSTMTNLVTFFVFLSAIMVLCRGQGQPGDQMPACLQKLMPCEPYLKPSAPAPTPQCCVPLKDMIAHEVQCLCWLFNDDDLLKTFNITKQDALNFVARCGAKADVSECKNSTGSATTPTPAVPSPPAKTPPSGSPASGANRARNLIAENEIAILCLIFFIILLI